LWTAVAVGAVAIALVAGALLTRDSWSPGQGDDTRSVEETATTSGPAIAGDPDPSSDGPPPASSGLPGDGGEADSRPPASSPVAQVPAAGSELETVTMPPARTLAMVASGSGAAGDTFRVAFRPYGPGPVRSDGPTLVIFIDSARRSNTNASDLVLASRTNALVTVSASVQNVVTRGGVYTGTLELVPSAEAFALRLTDVSRAGD
jgi:hypothetical protein